MGLWLVVVVFNFACLQDVALVKKGKFRIIRYNIEILIRFVAHRRDAVQFYGYNALIWGFKFRFTIAVVVDWLFQINC